MDQILFDSDFRIRLTLVAAKMLSCLKLSQIYSVSPTAFWTNRSKYKLISILIGSKKKMSSIRKVTSLLLAIILLARMSPLSSTLLLFFSLTVENASWMVLFCSTCVWFFLVNLEVEVKRRLSPFPYRTFALVTLLRSDILTLLYSTFLTWLLFTKDFRGNDAV